MIVLGIETSCDETSAAVVEETGNAERPWAIRSNIVASQALIHRDWGGVVPELASRQHIRDICPVVAHAMTEAGVSWADLGAIAVTGFAAWKAAERLGTAAPTAVFLAGVVIACIAIGVRFARRPSAGGGKAIEVLSGVWTLLMYLGLGAVPLAMAVWRPGAI